MSDLYEQLKAAEDDFDTLRQFANKECAARMEAQVRLARSEAVRARLAEALKQVDTLLDTQPSYFIVDAIKVVLAALKAHESAGTAALDAKVAEASRELAATYLAATLEWIREEEPIVPSEVNDALRARDARVAAEACVRAVRARSAPADSTPLEALRARLERLSIKYDAERLDRDRDYYEAAQDAVSAAVPPFEVQVRAL